MKILMVCLGNICRSPLAEGILRHKIQEQQLDMEVDSCGTSGWHDGERPQNATLESAAQNGVDMSGIYSRKFIVADFDDFDLIIVMDQQNKIEVLNLARTNQDRDKVVTLLSYDSSNDREDVPDPYYEGGFDLVYDLINNAIEELIKHHR